MKNYPERGELVLTTVERVTDHGAFVKLDEYGGKQGIVSLREFSPKWVKNPRSFLKEGQKAVLKVLRINIERGHIDLSLKEVNDNERRNKLKDFKLEIRVVKLMEHMAAGVGKKKEELDKMFGERLAADYGTLYEGFAQVSNGKEDMKAYVPDAKLREEVIKRVRETIKPTLVSVRGFVTMFSEDSDGVNIIKGALAAGKAAIAKDMEGEISYVSPPNYCIDITAGDYKTAEKALKDCYEVIEKYAASKGVKTQFAKELKLPAS